MRRFSQRIEGFLKRMFPTRVSFDDGSYIEYLNREAILYNDVDGRKMEIVWFFNPKRLKGRILCRTDINHWDEPHDKEPINAEKKKEIELKIIKYCAKRKIPLEIAENPDNS